MQAGQSTSHRHLILVVEDDHDTRDGFILLAQSVGLDAVGMANGREALSALQTMSRPCLIVLDVAMPEMDGFAFRRAQMMDPRIADIPVAVMTGGGWATEADARKLGLTIVLRKPVEPEQLLDVFTSHCGAPAAD